MSLVNLTNESPILEKALLTPIDVNIWQNTLSIKTIEDPNTQNQVHQSPSL